MLLWKQYGQDKMGAQGKAAAANKGVGGYRPTVNWREISIKRKNVADRQVLACIVFSGVFIIVIGLIITILGFLVISSQCPFMWEEGMGACFYFAKHNASWGNGKAYCETQSASMLDLHSETESDFIKGKMLGRSWLGLRRGAGEEDWKWLSNAKVNYTRWFYPSSGSSTDMCVMMEKSGDWGSVPCGSDTLAFVICDFVPGYNPFVLVGPVVILSGVAVLILSIEVCIRRKEFKEKNPEAILGEGDDGEREVDAGLINYGYGNFEGDDINQTVNWPPVDASSPAKSTTPSYTGLQHEQQPMVSPRVENEGGSGPMVHVVPASPSLVAPTPENTRSQEQLELLLSPKTLE